MVQHTDVQDLLNTGTWTTQRAKSPRPSNQVRANQSSKLDPLHPDGPKIPRSFPYPRPSHRPPPPTVEDEEISVARELNGSVVKLSDEEPKNRGAIEQLPIILPVSEYNSERRFVLVSASETDEDVLSDYSEAQRPKPPTKPGYTANSKIHLDPKTGKDVQPELQRRRSRTDLPKLETDVQHSTRSRPASYVHRSRSATCVDQKHQDASRDFFNPYPSSAAPAADAFLSPEVIKHATKGRDRAYWNLNSRSNGSAPRDSSHDRSSASGDKKSYDTQVRSSHSAGPGAPRRLHSDMDVPQTRRTSERPSSYRDEANGRTRNGPPSPSSDRRQSPPPPRLARKASSPARYHESQKYSQNRSTHSSRSSLPKEPDLDYSSDEHGEHKSRNSHRNRRKSTVIQEDRPNLLSPTGPRSMPTSKPKSQPPSPLPSPTASQTRFPDYKPQPGPRTSTTFNVARDRRRNEIERPVSPLSSGGSSSPRSRSRLRVDGRASDVGRPRASSRATSIKSNASSNKPVNAPPPINTTLLPLAIPSDDRKRQGMPPSPAWSRQASLETIPHPPSYWQPEPFQPPQQSVPLTPRQSGTNLEQSVPSVISYRRYSEDVNAGTLAGLPDCPRQRPRAGHGDWLTLPKYDSFNVCPSCYEQVFYPTEFRDLFVAAPMRSRTKEIACDLGTSPWYRIAWLMTRKYRRNDLRLLQGIADVSAKHKVPCYGPIRVTRIWYSIIDPQTRRCISNFTVCSPCAEAVQVLFPSLTGVFVPLDRPAEPRPGKCSLHFAPSRNRFVTYFDVLESTHDRAMASQSAPNVQHLADKVGFWAEIDECPRDEAIRHQTWYTMAHIPEVTVCEECFMDVVYPELVADAEAASSGGGGGGVGEGQVVNSVARNFYQKAQLIKSATVCQMASPWMKNLFRRACKREDGIAYLDSRVRERLGSL